MRIIVEVDQLGVLPESEGKGVGTASTQRAVEIAADLDATTLRLTVWTFNERAISMYARNGFEPAQLSRHHSHVKAPTWRVRVARPDDREAIAELNSQAWKVGFSRRCA